MNDDKGSPPYQVTKAMRVLGGFFTVAGAVWTGFLPREYDIGPTSIPQWWVGVPICAFGLYILLNATAYPGERRLPRRRPGASSDGL